MERNRCLWRIDWLTQELRSISFQWQWEESKVVASLLKIPQIFYIKSVESGCLYVSCSYSKLMVSYITFKKVFHAYFNIELWSFELQFLLVVAGFCLQVTFPTQKLYFFLLFPHRLKKKKDKLLKCICMAIEIKSYRSRLSTLSLNLLG